MEPASDNSAAWVSSSAASGTEGLPDYLVQTYSWAYLNRRTLPWLDRPGVVSLILWGNARRLMRAAVAEFSAGQRVLQAACVYGDFSRLLVRQLGARGSLDVIDVAPLQVENLRRKLADIPQARMRVADLAEADVLKHEPAYDGVCCFFLLHEVPAKQQRAIVDGLLAAVAPGGRIVFADYHRPCGWHPLRPIMAFVFRWLEPYAPSLLAQEITALSSRAAEFDWRKRTLFGGLYQIVVGQRRY